MLLGPLLSEHVQHLAVKCEPRSLDMVKLKARAPSIKELFLCVDHSNGLPLANPEHTKKWKLRTMECLANWPHLTNLTICSEFLNSETAVYLGKIAPLVKLTIQSNATAQFQGLYFQPDSFPSLEFLGVTQARRLDALTLVNQPNLMRRLKGLKITLTSDLARDSLLEPNVIERACNHAPSLNRIHFEGHLPTPEYFQPITRLPLTHLDLRNVAFRGDVKPLLRSLSPGLKELNVDTVEVSPTFIAELAARYPKLEALVIRLVLSHPADLDKQAQAIRSDTCLALSFSARYEIFMAQDEKEAAKTSFLR